MQAQISQHGPASEDAFWAAQALIWEQLTGMVAGYNAAVHASTPGHASYQHQKTNTLKPLTFADLHLLNSFGRCSLQCIMIPGTPSTRTQIFELHDASAASLANCSRMHSHCGVFPHL